MDRGTAAAIIAGGLFAAALPDLIRMKSGLQAATEEAWTLAIDRAFNVLDACEKRAREE